MLGGLLSTKRSTTKGSWAKVFLSRKSGAAHVQRAVGGEDLVEEKLKLGRTCRISKLCVTLVSFGTQPVDSVSQWLQKTRSSNHIFKSLQNFRGL